MASVTFRMFPCSRQMAQPGISRTLSAILIRAPTGHRARAIQETGPARTISNGGTSFAAPIVAGIQALINQKMNGAAQGNPNYVYYKLAAREYGANGFSACNSSKGQIISPYCVFNDVTLGDNDMDCADAVDCYRPSGAVGVEFDLE